MPRKTLDHELQELQDEIVLLGSIVEQSTIKVIDALKERDHHVAREIYLNDSVINDKRYAIENAIVILMATQQPLAHDLRLLIGMLEINTELERMGDYSKGIAKIIIQMGDAQIPIPVDKIAKMADLAVGMLHRALSAFITEDIQRAYQIPKDDDLVDALYNEIYHELLHEMIQKPEQIDQINFAIWAAHNLERMADRVTNICERTIFIATGETIEVETDDEFLPDYE
ncbi:MAG: phosphate signaling complex protein PhoU [Anaerolineaceae bacterium]|nr:phosphate signaling complex protein PhoU [Anaerolineaceae bacterium]